MPHTVSPEDRVAALTEHYAHCGALLHAQDRDRWLACLFAPEKLRKHLHALYAFSSEIARIREIVSDPMPGEIRMQWWSDAIEGEARGDVRAHPVADALIDTIRTLQLPRTAFTDLIEARRFDLYDDAMPDTQALETYCGHTSSALFRLASIILADGREPGGAEACGFAGVSYALTGLLRAFAFHAAEGRVYIPADSLERRGLTPAAAIMRPPSPMLREVLGEWRVHARKRHDETQSALANTSPAVRVALLPNALVPLYLARMEGADYNPFATRTDVAQWRRQWALWRASKRG